MSSVSAGLSLAGCVGSEDGRADEPITETNQSTGGQSTNDQQTPDDSSGWSTFRGDSERSGIRSSEAGPGESLSVTWQTDINDILTEFHDIDTDDADIPPTAPYLSWPVLGDDHVIWTVAYTWIDPDTEEIEETTRVVATNSIDGQIEWSNEVPHVDEFEGTGYWNAPELDDDRLYVPCQYGNEIGIAVYDPANGNETSRLELGLSFDSGQPLVEDRTIYVADGEGTDQAILKAFDASDGQTKWSVETETKRPSKLELTVTDETVWYFDRSDPREFVARDVSDGSERWRETFALPEQYAFEGPAALVAPTIADDAAYAAGALDRLSAHDVAPLVSFDPSNGDERWRYKPPELEGEDIPFVNADQMSQEDIDALPPFSAVYGYPVIIDGLVLATGLGDWSELEQQPNGNSELLFALDENEGTLEWGVDVGSITFAPVVAGDVVYLITVDGVEAVSTDGEWLDSVDLLHPRMAHPPALGDNRLFVPTIHGIAAIE